MNFEKIVYECEADLKNRALNICVKEKNIITLKFETFEIIIYYSAYEYEIGYHYSANKKHVNLATALKTAGCSENELPPFVMMSDETVMKDYIGAYLTLTDKYFNELKDTRKILKGKM